MLLDLFLGCTLFFQKNDSLVGEKIPTHKKIIDDLRSSFSIRLVYYKHSTWSFGLSSTFPTAICRFFKKKIWWIPLIWALHRNCNRSRDKLHKLHVNDWLNRTYFLNFHLLPYNFSSYLRLEILLRLIILFHRFRHDFKHNKFKFPPGEFNRDNENLKREITIPAHKKKVARNVNATGDLRPMLRWW